MKQHRILLLGLPLLAALAGCGGDTARSLGFTRDPPDEFQVTTRAPLSVPPRLSTDLPVPTPGAPRPQDQRPPASSILGVAPIAQAAPSGAERALLAQAGQPVPNSIRSQVDAESLRLDRPDPSVVDLLMFWRSDDTQPGVAVDPQREAQRLRENAALGRDSTEGVTPVAQPPRRGLLERLF